MKSENIQQFFNSLSAKMIIIAGLAVLLLIPSFLIMDIIRERIELSEKVKSELFAQWGGKQVVSGPVLNVPYVVYEKKDVNNSSAISQKGIAHFLPESLKVTCEIGPEKRKRGIYEVVVYESKIGLKGTFAKPEVSKLDIQNAKFNWEAAYFTLGITEMRGIKKLQGLVVNGQSFDAEPGLADTDLFNSGVTIKTIVDPSQLLNFETAIEISGSEELSVEALGKTTEITMNSVWAHPSFTGGFLPANREVTSGGFIANWLVTHLNRNFPQQWTDKKFTTQDSRVGTELVIPVDHYQKSMRSAKYAILFIALNFITFLFIELKSNLRIHPFQYLLVALALLVFYTLLVSFSEQTGFNLAYLISAVAVILLISWYSFSILKNIKMVIWITFLQTGLYLFLFIILQLQDYALLVGSIGLFLILAVIMRASQQIKWYSVV